jgi:multidrug efflux pump subunit AcrB
LYALGIRRSKAPLVGKGPGATAFVRIPYLAHSTASERVRASTPALLSLAGVFFLLWLTNVALNISSMMGMIMIIGIVGENAIFLIHYIQLLSNQGMGLKEALIEAGKVRLRPIFMATFAAVLALMPLALGIGAGAQMQQPLAIAVIGGFSLSAFLLLFLLPVFYLTAFNRKS